MKRNFLIILSKDIFIGNSTSQKLTIKEEVKGAVVTQSKPTYQKYSPQYGPYVNKYDDSNRIQHIDGSNGMEVS